jgi:hypothetical protein
MGSNVTPEHPAAARRTHRAIADVILRKVGKGVTIGTGRGPVRSVAGSRACSQGSERAGRADIARASRNPRATQCCGIGAASARPGARSASVGCIGIQFRAIGIEFRGPGMSGAGHGIEFRGHGMPGAGPGIEFQGHGMSGAGHGIGFQGPGMSGAGHGIEFRGLGMPGAGHGIGFQGLGMSNAGRGIEFGGLETPGAGHKINARVNKQIASSPEYPALVGRFACRILRLCQQAGDRMCGQHRCWKRETIA